MSITRIPTIYTLDDAVTALEREPAFSSYRMVRREHGALGEFVEGGASFLLLEPSIWSSAEREAAAVASCQRPTVIVICAGDDRQVAKANCSEHTTLFSTLRLPTTGVVLHATLHNAKAMLTWQARVVEQGATAERYRREITELVGIAAMLNSQRDISQLLALILEKGRYVAGADAGSVYVVAREGDPEREVLRFEVAQNDSIDVSGLTSFTIELSRSSIVGNAVLSKEAINISNMAQLTGDNPHGWVHDRSFDERSGYDTRSVLTLPMINPRGYVIGVLQLINKKTDPARALRSGDDFERYVVPFDEHAVEVCRTLAYQAAIALDNALLYSELRTVFEGFVEASVLAIEARDPSTSGHSRRVADLTLELARTVDREQSRPGLRDVAFTVDQLQEIEYAALLHDFGKVGVPENVLVKANKLYAWDLDRILMRFDYIRMQLRNETLQNKLAQLQRGGRTERLQALDIALRKKESFLDLCLQTIEKANLPTVIESEVADLLEEMGRCYYIDPQGQQQPYLTAEELVCLQIRRGSLNAAERKQIESHVVHTYNFLKRIPWGRGFRAIPEIAGRHHEKLDGSGYPWGKPASDIPVQARIMTICDIYDALTAADRPYKKALPRERALAILADDRRKGRLDGDLLEVFIEANVGAGLAAN
ncbi:MAG: GAF domain-containing protein [Deltaproteobacteria bacterium]|nr:GAF domain-containing protein [Deltaproteobacteria bacterium]